MLMHINIIINSTDVTNIFNSKTAIHYHTDIKAMIFKVDRKKIHERPWDADLMLTLG